MGGSFPKCQKCGAGELVPLSDYSTNGVGLPYKAWACTNPGCGFNLKIRNGTLVVGEPITNRARCDPSPLRSRNEHALPARPTHAAKPVPIYRVGAPYDTSQTLSPSDGEELHYLHGRFELALMFVDPRSAEVRDVRAGQAQFALFIQGGVVALLSSFGDTIDWLLTPLLLDTCQASGRSLPSIPNGGQTDVLVVLLVDAGSRLIRVIREITLTIDITQRWRNGVHQQAALLHEPGAYQRVVEELAERYPTDADLVEHAAERWADGGETAGKPWRR